MKNTDLMVGNWVSLNGCHKQVLWVKYSKICVMNGYPSAIVDLEKIEPIPLTEEILLKCGFEKCEQHDNFYQIILNDWTKIYVALHEKQYVVELSVSKHSFCPNVKYLHQLQNLYHALTGQELKIEL